MDAKADHPTHDSELKGVMDPDVAISPSSSTSSLSLKSANEETPSIPQRASMASTSQVESTHSSPPLAGSITTDDEEEPTAIFDTQPTRDSSMTSNSEPPTSPKVLDNEMKGSGDDEEGTSISLSEVELGDDEAASEGSANPDEAISSSTLADVSRISTDSAGEGLAETNTPMSAVSFGTPSSKHRFDPAPSSSISYRNTLPASPSLASTTQATFASSPSTSHNPSSRTQKRRTVHSTTSLASNMTSGGNNSDNYDFLLQRLETQNALLKMEEQQARERDGGNGMDRRKSRQQQLIDDFERKREELGDEEGLIDWDFWGAVMNDYEKVAREQPKHLSRAIQRGIPPALRGMMWQLMSASKDLALEQIYSDLLKQTSPHEKAIIRDLSRTFPNHEYFKEINDTPGAGTGQENLFNVVKAYSLYDEEVGYCQGLQFIVGPLLLNMPDEEAFCVLVRLMKSYNLRSLFMPNMPGLQLRLFQFDRLVEELLPTVFMRLLREGVKSSMYASQWFLTLFGYRFPLELVASVMDLVFAEGIEAVFRFSVALLKRNEDTILGLEFEQLLDFLKNGLFEPWRAVTPQGEPDLEAETPYRASQFVQDALQIRITPILLDQFAGEWEQMKREQEAHALELEGLRRVNAQLSLQVRRLEASLASINEEHCDLVKQVVMAKLEREELEEELVKYKVLFAELSHRKASESAVSATSPQIPIGSETFQPANAAASNLSNPITSPSLSGAANRVASSFFAYRPSWGRGSTTYNQASSAEN